MSDQKATLLDVAGEPITDLDDLKAEFFPDDWDPFTGWENPKPVKGAIYRTDQFAGPLCLSVDEHGEADDFTITLFPSREAAIQGWRTSLQRCREKRQNSNP